MKRVVMLLILVFVATTATAGVCDPPICQIGPCGVADQLNADSSFEYNCSNWVWSGNATRTYSSNSCPAPGYSATFTDASPSGTVYQNITVKGTYSKFSVEGYVYLETGAPSVYDRLTIKIKDANTGALLETVKSMSTRTYPSGSCTKLVIYTTGNYSNRSIRLSIESSFNSGEYARFEIGDIAFFGYY